MRLTPVLAMAALSALASCTPPRVRTPLPAPHDPLVVTEDSPVRLRPPHAFQPRRHPFPTVQQFTLENGFTVYLVEQPSADSIVAHLICRRCGDDDPSAGPGVAALTWRTLAHTSRGSHRSVHGMVIAGDATQNGGGLAVEATPDQLDGALRLLATSVAVREVSADAFERERRVMFADRRETIVVDLLAAAIFGLHHPYGRRFGELRSSLEQVGVNDVERYRRQHLSAGETALIVTGNVTRAALEPVARLMFGGWPASPSTAQRLDPPMGLRHRAMLVDDGHSDLAHIFVALPGVSRTSSDYAAMLLVQQIIGGLFGSRLQLSLRERLGLVYSAQAQSLSYRDAGMLMFGTQVETPDAVVTVRELLEALRHVRDSGVSRDELAQARRTWRTETLAHMEDLQSLATAVDSLFVNGLPADEFDRLAAAIDRLTTDDLDHFAARFIRPEQAMLLVVGDASVIGGGLAQIVSPIEFLNARH